MRLVHPPSTRTYTLFPYTSLFRSRKWRTWFPAGACIALVGVAGLMVSLAASSSVAALWQERAGIILLVETCGLMLALALKAAGSPRLDRKSTRLTSSH